ncbi:hypothetical protein BH11PSE10_BH11PSE10_10090 [soil metagenome]
MNIKRYEIRRPWRAALAAAAAALAASGLVACGGGGVGAPDAGVSQASPQELAGNAAPADSGAGTATALGKKSSPAKLVNQPANTEGRLLASNCFQCHGTLGTGGFDSIRGKDAREVLEFMNKPANSQIMAAHTQGYTPAQLQKIIAYLQQ